LFWPTDKLKRLCHNQNLYDSRIKEEDTCSMQWIGTSRIRSLCAVCKKKVNWYCLWWYYDLFWCLCCEIT
jgi:hypothetical protein